MARQPTLVGNTVLLVIDIQKSAFMASEGGIPHMPGYAENMMRARSVVDAAHDNGIPVIFVQEIHRRDMIDYGRELDGSEDIHCMEGDPGTPVAFEEMGRKPGDYFVPKRRYSCFFGTEMEILLRGLKAETLIFVGGMTDVCVHYSFADGHQSDYYCRVVADCVGGTSPEAHQASLNAMEYLQEGAVLSADEIIGAMGKQRMAAE
ncbi:cysteine hydrolase family protein [Antarctobacter sp.]|uniref:cysteine hydrolase family protein n=1 Tax=Antarctobacter sp. TaxID=1872577 RepID=UPI003A957091